MMFHLSAGATPLRTGLGSGAFAQQGAASKHTVQYLKH